MVELANEDMGMEVWGTQANGREGKMKCEDVRFGW